MMERINYPGILDKIKEETKLAPPGILPKGKSMDNYICGTHGYESDVTLTKDQVKALEKASPFALLLDPQTNKKS